MDDLTTSTGQFSVSADRWSARDVARHDAAVRQSLAWAHESAIGGEYADALLWMITLDAVGHTFSPADAAARATWQRASRLFTRGPGC